VIRLCDRDQVAGEMRLDFDFGQFDFVIDLGESRSGASSKTPEIDNPAATLGITSILGSPAYSRSGLTHPVAVSACTSLSSEPLI
jgi:hypothetical protein